MILFDGDRQGARHVRTGRHEHLCGFLLPAAHRHLERRCPVTRIGLVVDVRLRARVQQA